MKFCPLLFLFVLSTYGDLPQKPRQCCQYSKSCPSLDSCSIKKSADNLTVYPSLDHCKVEKDSKTPDSKSPENDLQCFGADFTHSNNQSRSLVNQVQVNAYLLQEEQSFSEMEIFGLEVAIPYGLWSKAKFRLTNNQELGCSPRCVEISRKISTEKDAEGQLLYDCELGLFHTSSKISVPTSGSTYGLDICLDLACQSYLMTMPQSSKNDSRIVLIEAHPLITDGDLKMHFPPGFDRTNVTIRIESLVDPEEYDIFEADIDEEGLYILSLGMNLDHGTQYKILYKKESDQDWTVVARFQTGHRTKTAMGLVLFLMFLFITLAGSLVIWKRYNQVLKTNQVSPNRLLESGRIKARNVLIISNVDNRHHIDIVLALGKYLKAHCAVGEVYFALDPTNGITSQVDHDPWKWAQETSERISQEKNGFLIFIAGPPPEMGLAIYKDLPNNQAFVGTAYLQAMAQENRVAVLHLPYSDPETVPKILPQHIRNEPYLLPKDTNSFLCQLLEVKMRELFPCVPYPKVKPKVLPHELNLYKGGRELLTCIEDMNDKVTIFRNEEKHGDTLPRNDNDSSKLVPPPAPSEVRGLLTTSPTKSQEADGVKIQIENGILSLNDSKFENRDKSLNPDLES